MHRETVQRHRRAR